MSKKICEICGRPSADYGEFLEIHGAFRHPPFPPEGTCGRANQAEDYYDNGQCEDCATYPLKKRIAELEELLAAQQRLNLTFVEQNARLMQINQQLRALIDSHCSELVHLGQTQLEEELRTAKHKAERVGD